MGGNYALAKKFDDGGLVAGGGHVAGGGVVDGVWTVYPWCKEGRLESEDGRVRMRDLTGESEDRRVTKE
ncbi:hypothetical protein LguiB_030652 [Lonicera macranthoides]